MLDAIALSLLFVIVVVVVYDVGIVLVIVVDDEPRLSSDFYLRAPPASSVC